MLEDYKDGAGKLKLRLDADSKVRLLPLRPVLPSTGLGLDLIVVFAAARCWRYLWGRARSCPLFVTLTFLWAKMTSPRCRTCMSRPCYITYKFASAARMPSTRTAVSECAALCLHSPPKSGECIQYSCAGPPGTSSDIQGHLGTSSDAPFDLRRARRGVSP